MTQLGSVDGSKRRRRIPRQADLPTVPAMLTDAESRPKAPQPGKSSRKRQAVHLYAPDFPSSAGQANGKGTGSGPTRQSKRIPRPSVPTPSPGGEAGPMDVRSIARPISAPAASIKPVAPPRVSARAQMIDAPEAVADLEIDEGVSDDTEIDAIEQPQKAKRPSRLSKIVTIRNAILGFVVVFLAIGAGALHGLSQRSYESAFLDELTAIGLRQPLHYRALTADPIVRNWTVESPEARLKGIDFSADSLVVKRAARHETGAVTAFSGTLNNIVIDPTTTFARNRDSLSGSQLRWVDQGLALALVSLGYGKPSGDLSVAWNYQPGSETAIFRANWVSDGFIDLRISASLGHVNPEGVKGVETTVRDWLSADTPLTFAALSSLEPVTLDRLSVVVTDRGVRSRLTQYDEYATNVAGSDELLAGRSQSPRAQLIEWLGHRDVAIRAPVSEFLNGTPGGSFRFDFQPPSGVRLSGQGAQIDAEADGVVASIDRAGESGFLSATAG